MGSRQHPKLDPKALRLKRSRLGTGANFGGCDLRYTPARIGMPAPLRCRISAEAREAWTGLRRLPFLIRRCRVRPSGYRAARLFFFARLRRGSLAAINRDANSPNACGAAVVAFRPGETVQSERM